MKRLLLVLFIAYLPGAAFSQKEGNPVIDATDTSKIDLKIFAEQAVGNASTNFLKAKTLLNWLSTSFAWTATDYQNRTVKEIIVRKGGNCYELAKVYMALINELGLRYRAIAEIQLYAPSETREQTSENKIKEGGNKMSVFGYQHNDHRWVEVYDDTNAQWIPVDPTMNLMGMEQWLKARAWFGERHTLNDDISKSMIAPFGIFVVNRSNKSIMDEDRTSYYMVSALNALYNDRLSKLPSWNEWVNSLQTLSPLAKDAFEGKVNLHDHAKEIEEFRIAYETLKKELKN